MEKEVKGACANVEHTAYKCTITTKIRQLPEIMVPRNIRPTYFVHVSNTSCYKNHPCDTENDFTLAFSSNRTTWQNEWSTGRILDPTKSVSVWDMDSKWENWDLVHPGNIFINLIGKIFLKISSFSWSSIQISWTTHNLHIYPVISFEPSKIEVYICWLVVFRHHHPVSFRRPQRSCDYKPHGGRSDRHSRQLKGSPWTPAISWCVVSIRRP